MSTKLTPSQIKKIIKEEMEKIIGEATSPCYLWIKDEDSENWMRSNFTQFQQIANNIISKYENRYTAKSKGWELFKEKILLDLDTWVQIRGRLSSGAAGTGFGSLNSNAAKFPNGVNMDRFKGEVKDFIKNKAEILDNQYDELDQFDRTGKLAGWTLSAGAGSNMDVLANRSTKVYDDGRLVDKMSDAFIEWLCSGKDGGRKTPELPVKRKKDCEKAKEIMVMIDKMDPTKVPEYVARIIQKSTTPLGAPEITGQIKAVAGNPVNEQQGVGFLASLFSGLGLAMPTIGDVKQKAKAAVAAYYDCDEVSPIKVPKKKGKGDPCIKFTKLAMQVTGTKDPKLAVKTVQELLVNRGYSVIKGQTDSPFAGGGKGTVQEKDFEKFGIDGRCGPGTMGAAARFQEDNTLNPDGLVGPKTWAVLKKGLSALSSKQKPSAPVSGLLGSDVQTAIRIYTYLFDQLDGDTVRSAQQILPRLVKRGSDFSIGGKTVSDQAALVNILNQNVEKLLAMTEDELNSKLKPREGVSLEPKLRLAQAKEMISKTPLQESKSYNMSFDKWSKLWE
jgi:hypothetical protein